MPASLIEIRLPEPLDAFVTERTESGGYASPAAFVEELLQAAWQEEMRERDIDAKISEAIHSEHPGYLATPQYWEEKRARVQERLGKARQASE